MFTEWNCQAAGQPCSYTSLQLGRSCLWESPSWYRAQPGSWQLPPRVETEEEQSGGEAPSTPIYTHSPGPKASLSLLSGASPGHTDQEDWHLPQPQRTHIHRRLLHAHMELYTHPRYTLTNQLTQRNTCNTLAPRDTFNNTNVPTDTSTRACKGAHAYTHPTNTQWHSDRHTRINTGLQNSRSWGARVRAP